jgi:hypothetical protein
MEILKLILPIIGSFLVTTIPIILSRKGDIVKRLEHLESRLTDNDLTTKRVELLLYINLHPEKVEVICQLYDEYKKLSGNHYVDKAFETFMAKHGAAIIERRV